MARQYARDNRGRFSSTGATARGGRLRTAAGNKRATVTAKLTGGKASGTAAKPKGLKPQDSGKLKKGVAYNRLAGINAKMGDRPDLAQVNIKGRFSGQAGKRYDAGLDRAVKQTKAAQTAALMKPKAQVRAERAAKAEANRAAQAAKPKRTRSIESLRASRAKQIEKRRSITTNPAGERPAAAAKMAANAARTQQRAIAFLKAGGKPARAAAKPAVPVAAKATRVGGRLNPASKADRAATKKVEQAMSRERAARSTAMRTQGPFSSPARQKANQDLENASRETASAIQTRRNIRAQFPVQTKTPTIRGPRIASTVAKPASTISQRQRAQSNLAKAEDKRTFTGQNRIKAKRTARKAIEFYENPRKALKNRKPGLGFRMPRGFR